MTETEILELAKQQNWKFDLPYHNDLITFTNAVAQRTREECAVVCENTCWSEDISNYRNMTKRDIAIRSMLECAAAIRSMTK